LKGRVIEATGGGFLWVNKFAGTRIASGVRDEISRVLTAPISASLSRFRANTRHNTYNATKIRKNEIIDILVIIFLSKFIAIKLLMIIKS